MAGKEKEQIVVAVTSEEVARMIAEALKGGLIEVKVKELIAEAGKDLVTREELDKAVSGLATKEELAEALHELEPHSLEGIVGSLLETDAKPPLDPAWLEGLTFRGSRQEKKMVDGRPKLVPKPFERPLTPEDVLGYSVNEETATITTADGKKHVVEI